MPKTSQNIGLLLPFEKFLIGCSQKGKFLQEIYVLPCFWKKPHILVFYISLRFWDRYHTFICNMAILYFVIYFVIRVRSQWSYLIYLGHSNEKSLDIFFEKWLSWHIFVSNYDLWYFNSFKYNIMYYHNRNLIVLLRNWK